MLNGIVAQLLAMVATMAGGVLVALAYQCHRQQAFRFWEREKRLPEATKYGHLRSLVEQEEKSLAALRDQVYDARQTIDEADRQRQWMEQAREEVANLQSQREEVERINRELETKQLEMAQASEQKLTLESDLAGLQSELQALQQQLTEHQQKLEELQQLKEQVKVCREELLRLEDQQRETKQQMESLQRRADEVRNRLTSELNELRKQKTALEEKLSQLEKEYDQRNNNLAELTRKRNLLEQEKLGLEGEINRLKTQKSEMKETISTLSNQLPAGAKREGKVAEDLWFPVFPAADSALVAPESEIEALNHLHAHLERRGLRFHKRTINAFHTSLKTTQSSPLVVLAGVSGTGKSELPRRYAEALGINFLNLAVQPRWDSPHDLFGFYDYLEQRFRPTELTRALIQMDQYRQQEGRGWDADAKKLKEINRSNEMALVLLDEMNLARVEYYFSEFLSRLETRRGIDPKIAEQRSKAEFALEVGGRAGALPMRILVDSNVLFVGTMNEDETTQSLSDKVIDRANVLRFGSPADVTGLATPSQNGHASKWPGRLQRDTWTNDWGKRIDQLDTEVKNRLQGCIKQLRKAMDQVQRPFAYRVSQAMLEYAANYPDPKNHVGEIISDQIEQKILPRLRGIDPTEAAGKYTFDTIEQILRSECNDALLITHLRECKRDNYFQWIGLDRSREEFIDA